MIDSLEDDCLERIASFLPKTSRAFFAVALTAPVERWCRVWGNPSTSAAQVLSVTPKTSYQRMLASLIQEITSEDSQERPPEWEITLQNKRLKRYYSDECQWEHFDTSDLELKLAVKLEDDDIAATLRCIGARERSTHIHLTNCINLYGSCLEMLRGSNVLELVDFNTTRMLTSPWMCEFVEVDLPRISEILCLQGKGQRGRVRTLMFPYFCLLHGHTNDLWEFMEREGSKAMVDVSAQTMYLGFRGPTHKKHFLHLCIYQQKNKEHGVLGDGPRSPIYWCHLCGGVEVKECHDCGFLFCKNDDCAFDLLKQGGMPFNCQSDHCSAFSCSKCFTSAKPDPCWVIPCGDSPRGHTYCHDCRRNNSTWRDCSICNACQNVAARHLAASTKRQASDMAKVKADNIRLKNEIEDLEREHSQLLMKQSETVHELERKVKELDTAIKNLGERFERVEFQHRSNDRLQSTGAAEGSHKRARG